MAENINIEKQNKGGRRSQKKSTRVDLTPMVDLGFLLITFFIFTTSMTTPVAMNMQVPNDRDGAGDPVCESCALTVLPAAKNKLYYYQGKEEGAVFKQTDYSAKGLRTLMMRKKKETAAAGRDPMLIIKPGDNSTFENMINIIDEANITMYKRYYLDGMTAHEKLMTDKE